MRGNSAALSAADVVRHLDLLPHPEGGHFRETFRDEASTGGRSHSTAIFYLLAKGERSHWHRVDAVEIWHFYAGAPLRLSIAVDGKEKHTLTLGADIGAGERPQLVVPKHAWQSAESLGDWSLVGCTVAPGFDFGGFEMAPANFNPA